MAPGGFIEKAGSTAVRPLLTLTQIQALLPLRGKFILPAPYNTEAIRITNQLDCNVITDDCIRYIGYSYWRVMNNHVGSDEILMFIGTRNKGPVLYSYNKVTGLVSNLGPLFDTSSPFRASTAEIWYFSASMPTKIYINNGPRLLRYDVISKQFEIIFDVSSQFGSNRYIWQMHSSNDDNVHSATLRDTSTFAMLGCLAYKVSTAQYYFYPSSGDFDECQIDKSGRWLVIKENVDGSAGADNRIIDLQTGTERLLTDQNGAGGHSDNGFGIMVATDNWNNLPNAIRVWDFNNNPLQGPLVYHGTDWSVAAPNHVAYSGKQGVPLSQQYACGSGANGINTNRANEIMCFRLDTSLDVLVVAPVMTDVNAAGGGDSYSKLPKGNLDVTGEYFIWTTNMGGNRLDAFIVRVPYQLLVNTGSSTTTTALTTSSISTSISTSSISSSSSILSSSTSSTTSIVSTSISTTTTVSSATQNVIWTSLVRATATGNNLQKTSGCEGCADSGGISSQNINSGNGYVEFTADNGKQWIAGLSNGNTDTTANDIDFGIFLNGGSSAEVRENGVYKTGTTYISGNVFRVEAINGQVKYSKNNIVFYTSSNLPVYPLLLDTSLWGIGATVGNAVISGNLS